MLRIILIYLYYTIQLYFILWSVKLYFNIIYITHIYNIYSKYYPKLCFNNFVFCNLLSTMFHLSSSFS